MIEGCVYTGTIPVETSAKINPSNAYIYGGFYVEDERDTLSDLNLTRSPRIVFLITDLSDQQVDGEIVFTQEAPIKSIALKPGKYAFGNILFTVRASIKKNFSLLKDKGSKIIILEPNKAYYVGDYFGSTTTQGGGSVVYGLKLTNVLSSFTGTTKKFVKIYKNFNNIEKVDLTKELEIIQ